MYRSIIGLLILSIFISCNENKTSTISGLWLVKKVEMGKKEMTPNARWMNFKEDATQTSGNGWLQHSFGTWSLKNNLLSINNKNGVADLTEPFKVELSKNKMLWKRKEEGENITVYLEKINEIPTSKGNELLGLWKLKSKRVKKDGEFLNTNVTSKETLFLRWDDTYVIQNGPREKKYGIYKIHGHKPELQIVNYGENPKFNFYKFSISKDNLTLVSTENNEELLYVRVHQFPQ